MRLCKGDIVEVMKKNEAPTGSWHCAEVIRGNGHTYIVKYICFRSTTEGNVALTERVPRKSLRPCPPPVTEEQHWIPGDHVEVYSNMSWKTATVIKYLYQHIFLVRLLGDSREFTVHRSHLRVRQAWEDGKWYIVGKGSCATPMKKNRMDMNIQLGINKAIKRKIPAFRANLEADNSSSPKTGVTDIDESSKRLKLSLAEHPSPLIEKVDDFIYPQEKIVHSLVDPRELNFSGTSSVLIESNQFNQILASPSRSCGINSVASSVGSCSIDDNIIGYKHESDDHDDLSSDAESFVGWSNDCVKKNVELFEHRLELRLYSSALKRLYVSGPLSWEDEMKMIDLRDALSITNDEHLVEIKKLISTKTEVPAC